jgi:hypothetical protein
VFAVTVIVGWAPSIQRPGSVRVSASSQKIAVAHACSAAEAGDAQTQTSRLRSAKMLFISLSNFHEEAAGRGAGRIPTP